MFNALVATRKTSRWLLWLLLF